MKLNSLHSPLVWDNQPKFLIDSEV